MHHFTPARVEQAPSLQPYSVSESLAHGLVSRLTREVHDLRQHLDSRVHLGPPLAKRAAAYRSACAYLAKAIPAAITVSRWCSGDQSGKDKAATYDVLHWGMLEKAFGIQSQQDTSLVLVHSSIDARRVGLSSAPLCEVTRHALMRLFFRMRTADSGEVMKELRQLGEAVKVHGPVLRRMPWASEILLPSARGAFVVQRDRTCENVFAALTWMSDERMIDNRWRQAAVQQARREGAVVVNYPNAFPILSPDRAERLDGGELKHITARGLNRLADSFFDDRSRLPADWRFHEPAEIPEGPPVGESALATPGD